MSEDLARSVRRTPGKGHLGETSVVGQVLTASTALVVAAGVVPTALATTGLLAIPLALLAVGGVWALWLVGYAAMGRYVQVAASFPAYVAAGLGRVSGVVAAVISLLAYSLLQVGLYGIVGPAAEPLIQHIVGPDMPWYVVAVCVWIPVTILGVTGIKLNRQVLAALAAAEVCIIVVITVGGILHPASGRLDVPFLHQLTSGSLSDLFAPIGLLVVISTTAFTGIESAPTNLPWARDGARTVRRAMLIALLLLTLLYASVAAAMIWAVGPADAVDVARQNPAEMLFALTTATLGGPVTDVARVLFLTSIVAGLVAFLGVVASYLYSLARMGMLPAALTRLSSSGTPWIASLVQSGLGFGVILLYWATGWDPVTQLFFTAGTLGGFGVLLLLTLTSPSVVVFFAKRRRHAESAWTAVWAPATSFVLLLALVGVAIWSFDALLGTSADSPARWLPAVYGLAAIAGIGWALYLRSRKPKVYAALGTNASTPTVEVL